MNIGKTIKELRIAKGFNQKTFASLCNITPTSLSLIENGISRPNAATIKEVCKVLNITEPYLFILSIESVDVPESKKVAFEMLFPHIKSMLKDGPEDLTK